MRTFCITSGKGGVGKTTLTVNLGIALAELDQRVLLLDGDLGLANLNVMLRITPKFTLHDVVQGRRSLSQVVIPTDYGPDIIPGASGIAELAELNAEKRANLMRGIEALSIYDVLLIDTGAGIGDNVINFASAADEVLIITTPDPASMTDAYGMIKTVLSRNAGAATLKLIVNRVSSPADAQRIAKGLSEVTQRFMQAPLEFLTSIPPDPLIEKSVLAQRPHLIMHPRSATATTLRNIAQQLLTGAPPATGNGLLRMFKNLMNR